MGSPWFGMITLGLADTRNRALSDCPGHFHVLGLCACASVQNTTRSLLVIPSAWHGWNGCKIPSFLPPQPEPSDLHSL